MVSPVEGSAVGIAASWEKRPDRRPPRFSTRRSRCRCAGRRRGHHRYDVECRRAGARCRPRPCSGGNGGATATRLRPVSGAPVRTRLGAETGGPEVGHEIRAEVAGGGERPCSQRAPRQIVQRRVGRQDRPCHPLSGRLHRGSGPRGHRGGQPRRADGRFRVEVTALAAGHTLRVEAAASTRSRRWIRRSIVSRASFASSRTGWCTAPETTGSPPSPSRPAMTTEDGPQIVREAVRHEADDAR